MMKRIVSLWLPRWPTDRLRRARAAGRRPPGRPGAHRPDKAGPNKTGPGGTPLALTAWRRSTVRISAVNAAAVRAGLGPGMALADARALLPGLATAPADPVADAAALARLAGWCGRYSPWTAVDEYGGDGVVLDITGCGHLFGGEAGLANDILRRFTGFGIEARAGLADTPGAAWAAARFASGGDASGDEGARRACILAPGKAREALGSMPIAALRLSADMVAEMERLGLRRVENLYALPRPALTRRFGVLAARRLDQALGLADEPISPRLPVVPYRVRFSFLEPIFRQQDLEGALAALLEDLCALLGRDHKGARRLEYALYRVDGAVLRLAVGTSRAVRAPDHLRRLFAEKFDGVDAGFGIEAVVLSATATDPLTPAQTAALPDGGEAEPAHGAGLGAAGLGAAGLGPLLDRLGNRLGFANVFRFAPRESHLPERAVARRSCSSCSSGAGAKPGNDRDSWPDSRRPLRLLERPEPVDAVAEVPDGPPFLFRWRRRAFRVVRADGPERIAPEWWRGRGRAERATRDYYRVEDARGQRFWLFREGLYRTDGAVGGPAVKPRWYLHGVFP